MGAKKRRRDRRAARALRGEANASRPAAQTPAQARTQSLIAEADKLADRRIKQIVESVGIAFLAILCLALVATLLGIRSYSLARHAAAQSWPEVPCKIVRNDCHRAAERGLHHFALEYEYTFGGQKYRSQELDLIPGEIGDEHHYRRLLARQRPEGSQSVCYVDPGDPTSAVLDREHMEALWLFLFFATPFSIVGVVMGIGATASFCGRVVFSGRQWRAVGALWGTCAGSLFVFWTLEGPTHVRWLIHPATQQTPAVVVFVAEIKAHFMGQSQRQIEFSYEVDGRSYEGECYAYWTDYRLDSTATAVYDPASPERSYLTNTTPTWSPAVLAWLALALALPVGVAATATTAATVARALCGL